MYNLLLFYTYFKNTLEIVELDSSKSGSIENIAANTRLNIEIGILNKIQAWIVLKIPIVQWVLPRIYPPKIII